MATSSGRTRTRLSPQQRKQQLLSFALDAFSKRGIGRAGHADIAEMANVSVATVFNYFPTREALVDVVLRQSERAFQQVVFSPLELYPNDAKSALIDIATALIDAALDDKEWLKIWFEWSTSIREDIWPKYVAGKTTILARIAAAIDASIAAGTLPRSRDSMELARLFDGICYILYLQAHQQPDKQALMQQAHSYIHHLFNDVQTK